MFFQLMSCNTFTESKLAFDLLVLVLQNCEFVYGYALNLIRILKEGEYLSALQG